MSRPRTPRAVAAVTGAAGKNPARHHGRNDPTSPLIGAPSPWLDEAQRKAWAMFVAELPWLVESDRAMLELAATTRANLIGGGIGLNAGQVYSAILSKLGATPVDRSRTVAIRDEPEEDEFFGRD